MIAAVLLALILVMPFGRACAENWELDASTGSFRVIVPKDGALKALGHDHVLESKDFRGAIELSDSSATLHLEINTAGIDVDDPAARRAEGYKSEISVSDRDKIRRTTRGEKVLDVRQFPFIKLDSTSIEPVPDMKDVWMVAGALTLRGVTAPIELPVTLTARPGGFWASGYVRLRPSDYGIKPVKAVGGLIKTADEAVIRFNLALRHRAARMGQ